MIAIVVIMFMSAVPLKSPVGLGSLGLMCYLWLVYLMNYNGFLVTAYWGL